MASAKAGMTLSSTQGRLSGLAAEIADEVERSVREYPAWEWLIEYWYDHADTLDIELPLEDEYDTLGGLVFSRLTEIPADGEKPAVECFGLRISVTEIADRRVEWAIVEKLPEEAPEEDDAAR